MSGNRRNNPADMTVREQIEDVREKVCDNYCKYPAAYYDSYLADIYETEDQANEAMQHEQCEKCPLMRL